MRILMVSMNSIHFQRWSEQLRHSGHDVYWFDILDQGYSNELGWMSQIVGWKKGFLKKKGRTFIKKRFPRLFAFLSSQLDIPVTAAFEKSLEEIQPDVVHSFALYVSCAPILSVMNKFKHLKWVYSSWGSDLFYFQHQESYLKDIKNVLRRMDYLFTDCYRDHQIALKYGFKGVFLGSFPGGGGFDLNLFNKNKTQFNNRRIIAVKGNQDRSGRALPVLKALENLSQYIEDYEVVVFGSQNNEVLNYKNELIPNLTIKGLMPHDELFKLFCNTLIYIGNSNSDGMPNTMLEAICAGAFPIQSNPGGATAEIINDEVNGFLIEDCENILQIQEVLFKAISNVEFMKKGVEFNNEVVVPTLEREVVKNKVLNAYHSLSNATS